MNLKKFNLKYQFLLLLSAAFWGASFIFTKGLFLTEPHATTLIIVSGRLLIATLVGIPFLWLSGRLQPIRRKDFVFFMALSFAEPFLYSLCETSGVQYVSGSLASIIVATIPLFVPFAMAMVYKERIRINAIIGIVLSMVGIAMMIFEKGMHLSASPKGILFLCGAVVIAVAYTLMLVRILEHYHPMTITVYQNLFSLVYFIPLVLIKDAAAIPLLSFSWGMIGRLAFLGIFCSTVAYMCFNYGMRAVGATAGSVYNNLIPVFSLILAVAIGQESISLPKIAGMAVVLAGLFIAQRNKSNNGALKEA